MEKKKLVYRVLPHESGVVFATPERIKFIARIHNAMESKTWAEFKNIMPKEEYEQIIQSLDEAGESRPKESDAFSTDSIYGYLECDYPPWLQQEMEEIIPLEMLKKYGTKEMTAVSGPFWYIPEDNLEIIKKDLQAAGYTLEQAQDLDFY